MKYTVHCCRTWRERFAVEVEAGSEREARRLARVEAGEQPFDWENTQDDVATLRVMFIDKA